MKKLGLLFTFILFVQSLLALSVTPNPSTLGCGTTSVTFTFDCAFTGSVLVPSLPPGSNIKTVTNGIVTFNVIVNSSTSSNFSINFVVISSDMSGTCSPNGASASAAFVSTCVLPQNNDCANASTLNIATDMCTPLVFSTTNATSSGSTPSCGVPGYLDLFYTFNANNVTVTMEIPSIPGTLGFYALYDGCPGSGSQVACSIMIASTGSTYNFTNLIVGTDYYLQILFLPGNVGLDQEICLHSTTAQPGEGGGNCPTSVVISDSGPDFPNQSYSSSQNITTIGSCTLTSNGIIFDAGTEVILGPGFDTSTFDFEAIIGGCTP